VKAPVFYRLGLFLCFIKAGVGGKWEFSTGDRNGLSYDNYCCFFHHFKLFQRRD